MQSLDFSNLLNLSPSNSKPLARGAMEDFATSSGEPITRRLNVLTKRRNQSKLNQEEIEEMVGIRLTWWN